MDALPRARAASAAELSASDRDTLYAALHRALWGDRIVSSGSLRRLWCDVRLCHSRYRNCSAGCTKTPGLSQSSTPRAIPLRDLSSSGARLHLPSADEEDAAAQVGTDLGVARLAASIAGGPVDDIAALALRLESLYRCSTSTWTPPAEYSHAQAARFDILIHSVCNGDCLIERSRPSTK